MDWQAPMLDVMFEFFNTFVIKGVEIYFGIRHSYDILGAGMLWKPEEARILKNFINQRVNIR